jgi:hypothetical protein
LYSSTSTKHSNKTYDKYYDADSAHRRHYYRKRTKQQKINKYYLHISDLFFCLAMALGWTVWMLSSFLKNDLAKYHKESVIVHGNVLHVSVATDSDSGIPVYKAVIDYMVPAAAAAEGTGPVVNSTTTTDQAPCPAVAGCYMARAAAEPENNRIQIRKQFETQKLLESGFANVELLVLPQEPTHSVLREDWEKEWEEQTVEELEWWRTARCRQLSVAFAGTLVLASIAGGVQVVIRLDPSQRDWGWAILCICVPLLLPTAIMIHKGLQAFQRIMHRGSSKAGFIVNGSQTTNRPFPDCEDLDDILDARVCDEDDDGTDTAARSVHATMTETAGCYFIRLPALRNGDGGTRNTNNRTRSEVSNLSASSTVSSVSNGEHHGTLV